MIAGGQGLSRPLFWFGGGEFGSEENDSVLCLCLEGVIEF